MRTRFCILAALALLSVGLTVWAHGSLYAQREAVEVEQEVLRGDPALAEGISLEIRTALDEHLFWETRITAGPELTYDTDYTYSAQERSRSYYSLFPETGLNVDVMGSAGITGEWDTEDMRGMQKPFNDVAARCPAGTEDYTEVVRLRNYYEVYPLYVQNDFFDLLPASTEADSFVIDGDPELELQELLREYFPIPVSEDATMEVRIDKDIDGEIHSYGGSVIDLFYTYSVVRQGGVYFIFSSKENQPLLDTSLFPLGYGVYFLPVVLTPAEAPDESDSFRISFGDPELVCPVDAAVESVYLCGEETGGMYLITQQEDALDLTILDETGASTQTLQVLEGWPEALPEGERWLDTLWLREGYLVVLSVDERFRVVETGGEVCRATLEGSLRPLREHKTLSPRYYDPALDYDGERLALASRNAETLGCFLALYGKDGLEHLSIYTLSLDREMDCYLYGNDALTVRLPR